VPSRWEVPLAGPADAAIPLAAPLAVVSGWLDDRQPGGGDSASSARSRHDDQARKWTCGPLLAAAGPGSELDEREASIILQVRLLDDGLADRLQAATTADQAATTADQAVRLGAHRYRIVGRARLTGAASWQELRQWSGTRAWQLRFVTPVCLRRQNRTSPWPAPDSVARGLAERWHRLDPATAPPLPGHGAGPVWVSDIDGHSEVAHLTRRVRRDGRRQLEEELVSGFVGRIRYVCDQGTDTEAADFSALLAFAAFAGAGSHTTYGFGVVVPEPTWQPPTVQAGRP
jgi:CRISPR-associated endoribonuclease Cas6